MNCVRKKWGIWSLSTQCCHKLSYNTSILCCHKLWHNSSTPQTVVQQFNTTNCGTTVQTVQHHKLWHNSSNSSTPQTVAQQFKQFNTTNCSTTVQYVAATNCSTTVVATTVQHNAATHCSTTIQHSVAANCAHYGDLFHSSAPKVQRILDWKCSSTVQIHQRTQQKSWLILRLQQRSLTALNMLVS